MITSCTFCRQHKIKCNASERFPGACSRCEKMNLKCEIDPQFRPKKGSQIQTLKSDVNDLKAKMEVLARNEKLLVEALSQNGLAGTQPQTQFLPASTDSPGLFPEINDINDSVPNTLLPITSATFEPQPEHMDTSNYKEPEYPLLSEFRLGDVVLSAEKASALHDIFVERRLPYLPIMSTSTANTLYHKSQLLFWTVMLTAALSEPEPQMYMSLASLIKQLAIETCWIRTPRSTHVVQALLILSTWPLPNEKVLDDCSYRFIGLAKNLALQLGLHRGGKFIQEFSRTQVSLGPDSETWRTRSWLAIFFCEQFWSSVLGLPPSINTTDYLVEHARVDHTLPKPFRCLISLSIFQCKLVNVMGISVTRPDGLMEPSNRAASLNILERELDRLRFKLEIDEGSPVEVYFLYVKLMICCFAFLPGTPIEDQVRYVSSAYLAATRIITITSQMLRNDTHLVELPIYIRQAITYSVFLLFKLHLSKYLMDRYADSARQSIVTVHRLLRNTLSSWKHLQNDISRTAKVLENLNIVLYTCPEVFLAESIDTGGGIITRMRSHLTASLFYDLIWCVHEARRRTQEKSNSKPQKLEIDDSVFEQRNCRRPVPLPFYNQITKDDFKTITTTTPNGTTVTTLVPTDHAMNQARVNATDAKKPLEINGITLAMLEATGSTRETGANNQVSAVSAAEMGMVPDLGAVSGAVPVPEPSPIPLNYNITSEVADQMDNFFQQQSHGWLNDYRDDDFLGWIDENMVQE
ncbi:suppressor protein sef1 [Meyerozyma guilliermondii]